MELGHEKRLLEDAAKSDRASYAQLYSHYLPVMLDYVYLFTKSKELSEEIVQDLFVKIWEKREGLSTVMSFRPYLFTSVKNRIMDHFRHQKVEEKFRAQIGSMSEESQEQSDYDLIYNQSYELVEKAILLLSEKRRNIFQLKTQQDLTFDEIADQLNISKSVVKKQYYTASVFIKDYLRKHGEIMTIVVILMYLARG